MSYQDDRIYALIQEEQHLDNLKRQLRLREKSLWARDQALRHVNQFPNANPRELRKNLEASLSPFMMPANIGGISDVAWFFLFQLTIDLGANPTIGPVLSGLPVARNTFQVDQEACFLIQGISRSHMTDAANLSATFDSPLQIDIADQQSSRRFNSGPIPLQMIGSNSNPSVLPTSMLLLPNAILRVETSSYHPNNNIYPGSGSFQLSFFGYRTRAENASKILSTTYGGL